MMTPRTLRLLLGLFAASVGAVAASGSVVQADMIALTRANSALVGISSLGHLQQSMDGGASFATTRPASGPNLYNLHATGNVVVAVGDGGFVVRSTNGGNAWADASSPAFTGELRDVAANSTFWVAVGRNNLNVAALWSSDDGASWHLGSVPGLQGTLRGVTYDASAGRWTAVGTDGMLGARILTSTDGVNWSAVSVPGGTWPLNDVAANGAGRVLAVGEGGTLLVSTNGGMSFSTDPDSGLVSEDLNTVVYSSTGTWVAGGSDLVQISYTAAGGAEVAQAPVPGGGDISAIALDINGAPILAGGLAGYQTITFAGPGDQPLSAGSVTLTATASSGLPVSFQLVSGPATLSGAVVTFTGAGTVTVLAVQAGNGSYSPAPGVQRSFEITVPSVSFDVWRQENFTSDELLDGQVSGAMAVASTDGLPNLVKYALGLQARVPATALPQPGTTATHYTYTYTRPAGLPDVTYAVEVSTNLTTWSAAGVAHVQIGTGEGTETWEASSPLASGPTVFFRLRVSRGLPE